MIIDGRNIARELIESMRARVEQEGAPTLGILAIAPGKVTDSYLRIKQRIAEEIGITLQVTVLSDDATFSQIQSVLEDMQGVTDGVVLQLPYPKTVDLESLLKVLPQSKDPDAIGHAATEALRNGVASVLPPVVAAIEYIARLHNISFAHKKVVVVGNGRLVGAPAAERMRTLGADVVVLTKEDSVHTHTKTADVVILGAGSPGLLTKDMVKEGVVIFDAGTSEEGGKIMGDADPAIGEIASVFTPVPGGIGPVAVAMLFRNLLDLSLK